MRHAWLFFSIFMSYMLYLSRSLLRKSFLSVLLLSSTSSSSLSVVFLFCLSCSSSSSSSRVHVFAARAALPTIVFTLRRAPRCTCVCSYTYIANSLLLLYYRWKSLYLSLYLSRARKVKGKCRSDRVELVRFLLKFPC